MANGGRDRAGSKAGAPGSGSAWTSPWRVILTGALAGVLFSLLVAAVLFLTVEDQERRMVLLYGVLPVPGAGVSACAASLAKGGSPGRALGVALLAVLGAVSLAGPLEYALLVSMVVPSFEHPSPGAAGAFPPSGLAAPAALAIALGTLLGLMLGRGAVNKRKA